MSHAVLVIDDDQQILRSLNRLLRRDGYEIHLGDNGRTALEILAEKEIAVIICDQKMPGMSGSEVLAEAAKLRPHSFRITLTGYTDLNAAQASINHGGISRFLLKPWDDEHLRSVVQEGVHTYQLIEDNRRLEAATLEQKKELEAWNETLEAKIQAQTAELRAQNAGLLDLKRKLEESLRDAVGVLASTLEAYSPNLAIHSRRVAGLARRLGEQRGLTDDDLRDVEFAAHLHDIGKISRLHAENARKTKPGKVPDSRSSLRHPAYGHAILSRVSGFQSIARAVQCQQERYDGNGYPEGLRREDIPLAARIIAVVNAYDEAVFPSSRPTSISRETGRQVLLKGRGTQFDPKLITALLKCVEEGDTRTNQDTEVELSPKQLREGMILSRDVTSINDVLLLKEGTVLTEDHVAKLRIQAAADPSLASVFITREATTEEPNGTEASQTRRQRESDDSTSGDAIASATTDPDEKYSFATPHACLTTPRHSSDDMACEPQAAPSSPAMAIFKRTILIVDDAPLVCNALSRDFRRAGFDSTPVNAGSDALDLVGQYHFDAAVIDLAMPTMPGTELVRRLQECAPDLPCVVLTSNASKQSVLLLAKAPNVARILLKPWEYDTLISTVDSAINERSREYTKEHA